MSRWSQPVRRYNFEIAFVQRIVKKRQFGFGNVLIGNDLDFPDMFLSACSLVALDLSDQFKDGEDGLKLKAETIIKG